MVRLKELQEKHKQVTFSLQEELKDKRKGKYSNATLLWQKKTPSAIHDGVFI
jgi:hypothetical protein